MVIAKRQQRCSHKTHRKNRRSPCQRRHSRSIRAPEKSPGLIQKSMPGKHDHLEYSNEYSDPGTHAGLDDPSSVPGTSMFRASFLTSVSAGFTLCYSADDVQGGVLWKGMPRP